jgi:3-isopropylmalate/(R)-2-methylmalate dehydratase small subunit
MEPFTRLEAIAAPLPVANLDTDQIVPARFLRRPRSEGFAAYLFHDLRFDEHGDERPGFVLNRLPWRSARILVALANFGSGSSREQAVYALWDYGIRAVIAPSFGEIFHNNALQNGLLPVILQDNQIATLIALLQAEPECRPTVDLVTQRVDLPGGVAFAFDINPFRKDCLLAGRDEIELTQGYSEQIAAFAHARVATPWL